MSYKITLSLVTNRVSDTDEGHGAAREAIRILRQARILAITEEPTVTVEYVAPAAAPVMIAVPAEHAERVRNYIARKQLV